MTSGMFAKTTGSRLPVPELQAIGKLSQLAYSANFKPLPAPQLAGVALKVAVWYDATKPVHRGFCKSPQAVGTLPPQATVVPPVPEKLQLTQAESQKLVASVPGRQACGWAVKRQAAAKVKNDTMPQRAMDGCRQGKTGRKLKMAVCLIIINRTL